MAAVKKTVRKKKRRKENVRTLNVARLISSPPSTIR